MPEQAETFDSWAVVELMGHVRMAGRLTEEERFGGKMGRLDVPDGDRFVTTYFTAGSVYRITPTTEELARSVAARNKPEPVHRYELPAPAPDSTREVGTVRSPIRVDDDEDEDMCDYTDSFFTP